MLCSPLDTSNSSKLSSDSNNNSQNGSFINHNLITTSGSSGSGKPVRVLSYKQQQPTPSSTHNSHQPPLNSSPAAQIREIKSRNTVGSLSPPCLNSASSQANSFNNNNNTATESNMNGSAQLLIERRQAISMERLNSISNRRNSAFGGCGGRDKENSGSLSSGCSNTSLDDSTTDEHNLNHQHNQLQSNHHQSEHCISISLRTAAHLSSSNHLHHHPLQPLLQPQQHQQQVRGANLGLTRSSSRVSRFKSAREFFERLSSVSNQQQTVAINHRIYGGEKSSPIDRSRGHVTQRYTAATRASSHANLTSTPILSPPRSRIKYQPQAPPTQNHVSSLIAPSISPPVPVQVEVPKAITTEASEPKLVQNPTTEQLEVQPQQSIHEEVPIKPSIEPPTKPQDLKKVSAVAELVHGFNCDSPQSPKLAGDQVEIHQVVFKGDNVIVGSGSLLIKRNKQLKIKFDETSTLTFEYPSEEALLAEPSSPASVSPSSEMEEAPSSQQKQANDPQQQIHAPPVDGSIPTSNANQPSYRLKKSK